MLTTTMAFAAALLLGQAAQTQEPASVTLTFETAAQSGAVMVGLYDEATYGQGQPIRSERVDIAAGQTSVTFQGLPAGEYGVKAFHDVNGDGKMNANPFGMPTEPFAFSNNAVGNMGPAAWDRARFVIEGETTQTISFR